MTIDLIISYCDTHHIAIAIAILDQKIVAVRAANEAGGVFLNNGNTVEAIKQYSKAIQIDATNHISYSNRSAAYQSIKSWDNAVTDAEKVSKNQDSIKCDLDHFKACDCFNASFLAFSVHLYYVILHENEDLIPSLALFFDLSFSLSISRSSSLSLSHSVSLAHSFSLTHTLSISHSLSLCLTHALSLCLSLSFSLSQSLSVSLFLSMSLRQHSYFLYCATCFYFLSL